MTAKNLVNSNVDEKAPEEASEEIGQFASPPCFQHEIDPLYLGIPGGTNLPTDEVSTGRTKTEGSDKC